MDSVGFSVPTGFWGFFVRVRIAVNLFWYKISSHSTLDLSFKNKSDLNTNNITFIKIKILEK